MCSCNASAPKRLAVATRTGTRGAGLKADPFSLGTTAQNLALDSPVLLAPLLPPSGPLQPFALDALQSLVAVHLLEQLSHRTASAIH